MIIVKRLWLLLWMMRRPCNHLRSRILRLQPVTKLLRHRILNLSRDKMIKMFYRSWPELRIRGGIHILISQSCLVRCCWSRYRPSLESNVSSAVSYRAKVKSWRLEDHPLIVAFTQPFAFDTILAYRSFFAALDATFATCLLYTSPSPRDGLLSRMPSSA